MQENYLDSEDELTQLMNSKGIHTWDNLLHYVGHIPYGRNKSRTDFKQVIIEHKGTCSTKHAMLKLMADLNGISDVKLILGIYKMNHNNTPGIGNHISDHHLPYLPEAHCYLLNRGSRIDVTHAQADFTVLEQDILEEIEIQPFDVGAYKIRYHQEFLKNWASDKEIEMSLDELWLIRENCITSLSG